MFVENYGEILDRITSWWYKENIEPCIAFYISKEAKAYSLKDANDFWPSPEVEPDLNSLAEYLVSEVGSRYYFGEALPSIPFLYGRRGTPAVMSHYLGGKVHFTCDTVWVSPIIERWDNFHIEYDEENYWFRIGIQFFETIVEKARDLYLPQLPPLGSDALTCLSLLRGTEKLLFDLIDNIDTVIKVRDKILELWPKYYKKYRDIYVKYYPGDNSWLVWAPGRLEVAECDFSVLLSPKLFEELVVPQIVKISEYVDYMMWHLDGPDEIKHLDVILDLPQIKAIQWVSGAGKPTAVHWIPMLKKIQARGKSLIVYAENEKEVEILTEELSPEGLFIFGGFTGKTREEACEFVKKIKKHRRKVIK